MQRAWVRLATSWLAAPGHRLVLWTTILFIVALGLFLGASLVLSRGETIRGAERTLSAFARISGEQTARTIQGIDQVLLLARNVVTQAGTADPAADAAVQSALRGLLVDRPFLRSFWLLDAAGRIAFNSSGRYIGNDVSDRPFYRFYLDNPAGDFAIHLPVEARSTGEWYMTVTRPWRRPDGRLGGVIVATPERGYFEKAWSIDSIGGEASVTLFHRDGLVLIRSPYLAAAMGRSFAGTELFSELLPQDPEGVYLGTGLVDGVERVYAYRALADYPSLVVQVGQTLDRVLSPWRQHVWIALSTWSIGSLAAVGGVLALMRSLRTSERRLESARLVNLRILETSVDLILIVDRRGQLIQVSPSSLAILGYRSEEMAGHNAIEFIEPADLETTRDEMRQARRGKSVRQFICRYVGKDGRIVVLSWTGAWSENAEQYIFIGRDMTDQQAMEQQLLQAQKMEAIGQLTGGVAHDFNNLLTVLMGNAELLAQSLEHTPELRNMAEMMVAAATRGAELTRSLLAFARRQPLEPKAADINRLVADMSGLLRRTLGEHVEIDLRCDDGLWLTLVDAAQLEAAVLNLIVNARDAMPRGGRLTIETANAELDDDYAAQNPGASAGAFVSISVSDTGTGMTPEVVARAFEPFFTTKEIGKGSGLGLSMVYGFVKQSNGHVKIYSELGHGTTIRLYLPRATDAEQPDAAVRPATEPSGGTETILVVEDDDTVRAYVEQQLTGLGYRVHAVGNGPEALAILERVGRIDLLFTDVVMPGGLNGPQLAEAARRLQPDLKVLFTSGYTENAIVHQGRLDVGVELLNKPYRRRDLAAKLRKVLEQSDGGGERT